MTARASIGLGLVGALWLLTGHAMAADSVADCDKLMSVNPNDSFKQNPDDVHQCILRGYDPPVKWRRNEGRSGGVSVGGSSGFGVGVIQGPERSPGANGADPSASASVLNFALKFPPWAGFPCQLPGGINICGGGGSSSSTNGGAGGNAATPTGACPAETDTSGTFGSTYALGSGSVPLVCGGAIPLTTYEMSLTRNADRLAATEYGANYLWVYESSGAEFRSTSAQPLKLPSYLCKPDGRGNMTKSVTFVGPTAQMMLYQRSSGALNIRMIPPDTSSDPTAVDSEGPEKFLVIPLVNGEPQPPADCALETNYYKSPTTLTADLTVEAGITPACEGSNCSAAGATTPASSSCDVATVYPSGTTQTTAGPIDCSTTIQMAVLSRPNLLYPPGATPQTVAISGRTGVLAQTVEGASLYAQHDAVVHVGRSAPPLVLPSGGTLAMQNGGTLAMSGPATLNPASGEITLTNGGQLLSPQGSVQQSFSPGDRIAPALAQPITLHLERNLLLPTGYLVPTQPSPYVRLPVSSK